MYPLDESSCPVCHITRDNRNVVGRITQVRTPKPPPEQVEVAFPVFIKDARFNLPLDKGSVWSSGSVIAVAGGFFLLSEKDGLNPSILLAAPPPPAGPVGPTSLFVSRDAISRILHQKLIGEFIEIQGRQKIPLRLTSAGWADLDVICDQMGIPRS
jgi:hypothetical protein